MRLGVFILIAFCIASCAKEGEEFARFSFKAASIDSLMIQERTIPLNQGDKVDLWSDMDVTYSGELGLRFKVQVEFKGEELAGMELDAFRPSTQESSEKTETFGATNWKYSGRQKGFRVQESGDYLFKVVLAGIRNSSLKIRQADLVLKR